MKKWSIFDIARINELKHSKFEYMPKYFERELVKQFKSRPYFERDELYDFYRLYEPELNEGTFGWRIYALKKKGLIKQIKRGIYTISLKEKFVPDISDKLIQLAKVLIKDFEDIDYCITTTEWLNYFTRHQLGRFFFIIEVEKDFLEDVFHAYQEVSHLRVYLKPDELMIERYMEYDNTLIIKPLVSRSPKQKVAINKKSKAKVNIPTIEKFLVDIFSDDITYFQVQGREMETVFERAIEKYNINYSRLLAYAKRRAKREQLEQYLGSNFKELLKDILE